ncbi:FadR family transcriptional regulator [Noviherbaspirillum cavernae]|uniref:FadR family transcriptional regulator n=1 Tax=Noviherbaspirillum cavernae TaxID=2320862 RepID=A0A418WV83_9BURK|nr:FadR/GntR family transcriptional regulator [Noviherbaspirillum cavernae]RJF96616.1 FadR family transcriptional regulator [Noviherbaspirillum cavernae]
MANAPQFRVTPLNASATMPERVTQALLELIRSGEYPAKSRLPSEAQMAERFGVSRTVIREAVSRLKSEGLVESRQGSGVFVREVSLDTPFRIDPMVVESVQAVLQVAELRRSLEAEIAALAAERCTKKQIAEIRAALKAIDADVAAGKDGVDADMEFHRSIARATGNPHFVALWDFVGQFLKGAMAITRSLEAQQEATRRQVIDEHKAIYEAIASKDPEAARTAARQHMEMASQRIQTMEPKTNGGSKPRRRTSKPRQT